MKISMNYLLRFHQVFFTSDLDSVISLKAKLMLMVTLMKKE